MAVSSGVMQLSIGQFLMRGNDCIFNFSKVKIICLLQEKFYRSQEQIKKDLSPWCFFSAKDLTIKSQLTMNHP